ncbi:MAG: AAA family ATPase [Treponema sp.]|uniref:AAA family ATPase n=1 Tax=Treponema sp. TaxID=166 RepID=UPI002A91BEA7|nr:AAA family ATPase [Treponema sp.]MDY6396735.1 AAA family ATPase [Treponema sp.]
MKILQMTVEGLPLFKDTLKLDFFAKQRVSENDANTLFSITPNLYLNCVNAFVGINASGKTTVLKTILFALNLLQNKPINHIDTRSVLGDSKNVSFELVFSSNAGEICKLKTGIVSEKTSLGSITYKITSETLYVKKIAASANKKHLLDFSNIKFVLDRTNIGEMKDFLPDDVSVVIAYNKANKDFLDVTEMLFLTDINFIPFSQIQIPSEVVEFLDPSIDSLSVIGENPENAKFHIQFKNKKTVIVEKQSELNYYLSSGTIKGITVFMAISFVLAKGGYLVVDEIENHFNKEIVSTIIRFFMDSKINVNGAVLIYSTHYPELLDEHNRNDSIYITKNIDSISVQNLSESLKRNDIKKSDAFQSGYLDGTAPAYNSYINLKNYLKKFTEVKSAKTL